MTAIITGKITGTTLTVSTVKSGTVQKGLTLTGTNVLANTVIVSGSGTTWTVNNTQTVEATEITGTFLTGATATAVSNQTLELTDQEFNTQYAAVVSAIVTATTAGYYRAQVALTELGFNQTSLYLGTRGFRVTSNRDGAATTDQRTVTIQWNLA